MWTDVVDLRTFYRSRTGRVVRRIVRDHLAERWPDVNGQTVLGIGYPTPFLGPFREQAERVIAVMPARQGVAHWPADGPNLTTLAGEAELPLPDLSMDRVLLVHALESSEQLRPMLREVWRVMADGARLMVVVPNRAGIWARLDRTPFGHGHPYTQTQLTRLLRDNMFEPLGCEYGLFVPPSERRVLTTSARAWERVGTRWFPRLGGVLIAEASKLIYAATPAALGRERKKSLAMVPGKPSRAEATETASEPTADRQEIEP